MASQAFGEHKGIVDLNFCKKKNPILARSIVAACAAPLSGARHSFPQAIVQSVSPTLPGFTSCHRYPGSA